MNQRQQIILDSLSPPERQQFMDLLQYLGEKAGPGNPSGQLAEGSVAALINRQSPRIQAALKAIDMYAETPRFAPFQPKLTEAERFNELGLDPDTSTAIKSATDTMDVAARLQRKMGTDADQPADDSPPTMQEILSAAYDNAASGDEFLPGMSGAADHLERRTAIERIHDVMENYHAE